MLQLDQSHFSSSSSLISGNMSRALMKALELGSSSEDEGRPPTLHGSGCPTGLRGDEGRGPQALHDRKTPLRRPRWHCNGRWEPSLPESRPWRRGCWPRPPATFLVCHHWRQLRLASVSGVGPRVPAVVAASDDLFVTASCARPRLPLSSCLPSRLPSRL